MTDKAVGVRLSADISGYVSAMGQAAQATKQVSASAQDAGKKASASFGSGLASAAKVGATALTATAAAATALGVAAFKGGVSYNALQQSSRAALTTILKGSTAANAQMDKLDAFAKNSPFAKQIFINAQQQLLGFGLTAEKVIPALDAIQNSVAAVGGSNDDIANVTDALAKMLGQGKLAGDTLNRLGMYGIDAASIIGKAVGKTGAEIRDMASKPGGIPADKVWDILINGLQDRFGGAAANVKKTWVGATDRIKGAWRDMGSALAEAFVGHKGGGLAIEWVNKFADMLRAIEAQVKPLVDAIMPKLSGAFGNITPLLEKATKAIKDLDPAKVAAGFERLAKVGPGIAAVSAAILAMGGNSLGLEKIGLRLNPVVAGITALVAASPEGRAAVGALLEALKPLMAIAGQLAGVLAGSLTTGMQGLGSVVQGIAPAISLLTSGIGTLVDGFKALPGPVQLIVGSLAEARVAMALLGTEAGLKLTKPLRDMADTFRSNSSDMRGNIGAWRDLTAELRQANPALSGVQASIMGLSTGTGILSRMSNAFMDAAVQAKRFPNAAGAAAAAMTGLKGAASGLLSAISGNVWTIAIGAAVAGIGAWSQAQENAKRAAQDLADTIDRQTGKFTEASRLKVVDALLGDLSTADVKLLDSLGISIGDAARIAIEGGPAFEAYKQHITDMMNEAARSKGPLSQQARALDGLGSSLANQTGVIADSVVQAKARADATKDMAAADQVAAVAQDALRAGIDAVGGAAGSSSGDIDGMGGALDGLGGKAKDAKDQLKDLMDMIDSFAGGERALRADKRQVDSAIRAAKKAAAEKAGADPKALKAQEQANKELQNARNALAKAQRAGDKDKIGSAQERVARAQENVADANERVASSFKSAIEVQQEYEDKLDSIADAGDRQIKDQMKQGRSLEEIAAGYKATRDGLIETAKARGLGQKAAEKEVDQIFMTKGQLEDLVTEYGKLHPEVVTKVVTKGGPEAIAEIKTVTGIVNGVPKVVDIKFNVTDAGVRAAISGITKALGPLGMPFNVFGGLPNFKANAAGGFDAANGHQAEIAKGGAWRVWAEPETRGESYIPHANDWRRPRAKAILEQTARLFGGSVSYHAAGSLQKAPDYSGLRAAPMVTRTVVPIDYDKFAAAAARQGHTFNISGPDAHTVAREVKAMLDWEASNA